MDFGRTLPAHVDLRDRSSVLLERMLDALADALCEGMMYVDEQRRIARVNDAALAMLGLRGSEVLGVEAALLLHPHNAADVFFAPGSSALRTLEVTFRSHTGELVPLRARCAAFETTAGITRLLTFPAARRIDEIEQLKNELVGTVSHELKTPLASIKAYTATMRQNPRLPESRREEFLRVVEQQADRLTRLIDDMLTVSRVEPAQLLRRRVTVPLKSVVDEAIRDVAPDFCTHPIDVGTQDVAVSCDPARLRNVLANLIDNAVKYSPRGGRILVTAGAENGCTHIEVRDEGIGIESEHLPYIFDRFYRVETEETRGVAGAGLGLAVAATLVRAHGGTIGVRSRPGAGTTIAVSLPLR